MTDHHQFVLSDLVDGELTGLRLPADDSLVMGNDGLVSVITGAYAAPVEVTLAVLDRAPASLDKLWEDAVELSVQSSGGIGIGELFDGPTAVLCTAPGSYRLRVGARGRDRGEERGDVARRAKVIEQFLIQAWPAPPEDGSTLKATSLRPVDHTAGRRHLAPARAAAQRIVTDLGPLSGRPHVDGGRVLSGRTGTVEVDWTYRATRRKLFLYAAFLWYWTSAMVSGSPEPVPDARYQMSHNDYRDIWDGIPTGPDHVWIEGVIRAVDQPTSAVTAWSWVTGPDLATSRPILETTLTVSLDQRRASDGTPVTTLRVNHAGLPREWLEDMTACWRCKLESGETVYRLDR